MLASRVFSSSFCLLLCLQCGTLLAAETGGDNRALPAYQTETWPVGRLLVWAHPGQSGPMSDPAQWNNADGSPAATAPDRHTDIVLPAAGQIYEVQCGRTNQVRHVTIENNAKIIAGHRNEVEIWGNCHIKAGGIAKYVSVRGDKHTFFRLDEGEFPTPQNRQQHMHPARRIPEAEQCRTQVAHKFQISKMGTASVEIIGNVGISDEVMLQHGRMIVSGDFRFNGQTGKGALEIFDGAILEIQSGGRVGPMIPQNTGAVFNVNVYRNGTLQAGSPERPLTRDAYLMLGFAENEKPGLTGIYAALGSMIRVYSSDPQKARLVVSSVTSVPGWHDGLGKLVSKPEEKAAGKKGVAMQLSGDVRFDSTLFDYISAGGIAVADPAVRQRWKNVAFGPNCAAAPDALFGPLAVNPNEYYHPRNDMESEWGLTVKAMAVIDNYNQQYDQFQLTASPASSQIVEVKNSSNNRRNEIIQTPVAVIFEQPIEVAIASKVPGAKMRYTTDGLEPTKDSPVYAQPIRLTATTRLMVKAYKLGVGFSPTFSTTYVFK